MLGSWGKIEGDWRGWANLLNVITEMKKRNLPLGNDFIKKDERDDVWGMKQDMPYVPDIIFQEIQKLKESGNNEAGEIIENRLNNFLGKK